MVFLWFSCGYVGLPEGARAQHNGVEISPTGALPDVDEGQDDVAPLSRAETIVEFAPKMEDLRR